MKTIKLIVLTLCMGCSLSLHAMDTLKIVENKASKYKIVYANGNATGKSNATQLQTAINNVTGCKLVIDTDATAASEYEIILGPTNARLELAKEKSLLSTYGYRIVRNNQKLIITATDDNHMAIALQRFETVFLKDATLSSIGTLIVPERHTQVAEFSQSQATLRGIVSHGVDYSLSKTKCVNVPSKTVDGVTIKVGQGACTDGTYVYFVNRNSGDTKAIVYKYQLGGSWSYVSETTPFNGGHCNDLVYDWVNKRVLCLKGGTDGTLKEATVAINPSSMATSTGPTIPNGATALDFNRIKNMYVHRYGSALTTRTEELVQVGSGKRTDGNTMTSQGMGSDEEYFYFPMSPKNGELYNAILVYDWETVKFKRELHIPGSTESEGMFEWNGVYYMVYYESGNGSTLYKLNVTLKYTAGV